MVRTPSCDKNGLRKGTWTAEEDKKLIAYVTRYGCWNWRQLPKFAGLQRCGKSCRLRWMNYLRPNIKRGNFSEKEEEIIIRMHTKLGNRWSLIATHLPGRTDNEIKNHWHTSLKRRFQQNIAKIEKANKASNPTDNETNTSSVPNNVAALQVVPPITTSQISDSTTTCSLSPLSTSSSELSSTISRDNSCEKLVIEDYDFSFLDDAFWTKTKLADISYTPPSSGIVSGECYNNDAFEILDTTQQSIIDQFSSENMVLESDFGSFLDAQAEVTMDNFWTQPYLPDVFHAPSQILLTPLETDESQYFTPVHGVDYWTQNNFYDENLILF